MLEHTTRTKESIEREVNRCIQEEDPDHDEADVDADADEDGDDEEDDDYKIQEGGEQVDLGGRS